MSNYRWFSANADQVDLDDIDVPVIIYPTDPPSRVAEMRLNVVVPDNHHFDGSATSAQLGAVQAMWPQLPDTLGFAHCHALLCYRDYAGTLLDYVFKDDPPLNFDAWQQIVATMVSYYPPVAHDVRKWSERRYRNQLGSPRISQTKYFDELVSACAAFDRVWSSMITR